MTLLVMYGLERTEVMKVLYKGLINANGRTRYSGCSSCGSRRPLSSSRLQLQDEYNYTLNNAHYRFVIGNTYEVPDDLGETLLKKFSYRNGTKFYAFQRVDD